MNLVSIIVPIYKVEKYLRKCIDSILFQSFADLQIILIDDGSPDGCGTICDEYAQKDNRVIALHSQNGGLSAARNKGLSLCDGKYVFFVDSDDYLEKNAIETLYNKAEADQLDILLYDAISFDEENINSNEAEINKYIRKNTYPSVCTGAEMFIEMQKNDEYRSPVQYCFFRKTFLENNNLRFHEGILHEDEEFSFLALMYANRVTHINTVLYHHRFRSDSIMGSKITQKTINSCYEIIKEIMKISNLFLMNSEQKEAFIIGFVRFLDIFYGRVHLLKDSETVETKISIKELKKQLRHDNYYNDCRIRNAVLDKKNKKLTVKKLKMTIYPKLLFFRKTKQH